MARKIKLGWNEKQDDRFSAALDLGIKMHKEIEAGPDYPDYETIFPYEIIHGNIRLKGSVLKLGGKQLLDNEETFRNVSISSFTLRWMMFKGKISTFAFLHVKRKVKSWSDVGVSRVFVFMARKSLNMDIDTNTISLDDIITSWRRVF